jgi:phosphate transport system substrate-binding protein
MCGRTSIPLTLILCAVLGCSSEADRRARRVTLRGSDTMVPFGMYWAEEYTAANPRIRVSVNGGGSGTGLAALVNGTADLAMASRSASESELRKAADRGQPLVETVVGFDAIAVIVHPDNPVGTLTVEQLRGLFDGTITNWAELGGPDRPVQALSRESNSGTFVFFSEHVLNKGDLGPAARLMPSSSAIVQSVAQDVGSIGYVGLEYSHKAPVKLVALKASPTAPAVEPAEVTVRDKTFPLARPLFLYSLGAPQGAAAEFLDWVVSPAGQELIADLGGIPLK